MKALLARECTACGALVLERRKKAAPFCPNCGAEGEMSEWSVEVLKLDAEDFPARSTEHPDQTHFEFAAIDPDSEWKVED